MRALATKLIDVVYHYIRDLQHQEKINISYVSIDQMIADGLTKSLAK